MDEILAALEYKGSFYSDRKISTKYLDLKLNKIGVLPFPLSEERIKEINWVVVQNRLSSLDVINKRNIGIVLTKLSKRFGITIVPGFGDRVIFKELFLLGLTLHDSPVASEIRMSTSVLAARQELRDFIKALNIINGCEIRSI